MPQDWKSWKLKRFTLVCTVCIEIALIAVIIITTVFTRTKHGFVAVSDDPIRTIGGTLIKSRLQWSAIPAIVMSIFGLLYAAIVASAAQRQPFVELMPKGRPPDHRNARSAQVTIALDYPSYPIFYSWLIALGNRHLHLASALFFQFVASVLLVALASNLFAAETAQFSTNIKIMPTNVLNLSLIDNNTPLLPALDLASAIWLYGAKPPIWMTENISLEDFSPLQPSTGNLTVAVAAFGVKPQCQKMSASDIQLEYASNSAAGTISISFIDRGCKVEPSPWVIISTERSYSYSWTQGCSTSDIGEDRIGIFAAAYDASSSTRVSNTTVVSCFPTYWNFSIELSMSVDNRGAKEILGVKQLGEEQMTSNLFRTIHSNLVLSRTQENTGALQADSFGRVVLGYAQRSNPNVQIDPDSITNATGTIYSTFFAALARNELMTIPEEPSQLDANLLTSAMRLFTVDPIAYTLGVLMFMIWLSTVGIFVHVEMTKSCLQEEPKGLLRLAMLLWRSDLMAVIEEFRLRNPTDQSPGKSVEKHWSMASAKCWYDESVGSAGRVRVEGLQELPPGEGRWQKIKARLRMLRGRPRSADDIDLSEQEPLHSRTKTVNVSRQRVK